MIPLTGLQGLYDRNRFLEAFRQSTEYWNSSQRLEDLSSDELILGGRLAARLGGGRLARWLLRAAFDRNPADPRTQYYSLGLRRRGLHLFDQLRSWEVSVELSEEGSGKGYSTLHDYTPANLLHDLS